MPSFVRGHVEAFDFFGGVPRVLLYDNLKSAVLERAGDAIRFHPTLLELAAHYHYLPRPVAPARGNQKGDASHYTSFVRSDGTRASGTSRELSSLLFGVRQAKPG
jgi:transposase